VTKKLLNQKNEPSSKISQPRHEFLSVAETVAREKDITKEEVLEAMELAMKRVAIQQYGEDSQVDVVIDRISGNVKVFRCVKVVEKVDDFKEQLAIEKARSINPLVQLGDIIEEPLPSIEFGRGAAHVARQVIKQRVREVERSHHYEEFKDRIGEIVNSVVKRVEFGNVVVDLGRAEAVLRRENAIPRESFAVGDRLRAIISELRPDANGPMVILSRAHPLFLVKLFEQEVPEIYDGSIEIKAVARDPGSRGKIAVYGHDGKLDPVGSCVGIRGARVQAVTSELQGEKIDIIPWSSNLATFIVNALAPAEVLKVVIDEDTNEVTAVVDGSQLSLAIGRRGQNVRLASQLTGFRIEVLTEEADSNKRGIDMMTKTRLFMEALDVDEMFAQLLVTEGFSTVENITEAENIGGLDQTVLNELQQRALEYLKQEEQGARLRLIDEGMQQSLAQCELVNHQVLRVLLESSVLQKDDLAELSTDELMDILGEELLSTKKAEELILWARADWFDEPS
jgi:N utilization substance protein A